MSFGNTTETDILNKLFNNTTLPFDGITDLYLALHTGDPGEGGSQLTNEGTIYTSYARVAVNRSVSGWTVSGATATNASLVQFPQCTGSSAACTYVSIGTAVSGAGQILISGALSSTLNVSNLIQPQFAPGSLVVTLD